MNLTRSLLAVSGIALLALCPLASAQNAVVNPVSVSLSGAATLFPANNVINGSGLEFQLNNGDVIPAVWRHNFGDPAGTSWVSTDPGGFPADWFAASGSIPAFVFDLGQNKAVDTVHLWAYAGGTGVAGTIQGNSARTVLLQFNTEAEGNSDFFGSAVEVPVVDHGPVSETAAGFILPRQDFALGSHNARYVKMLVTDNWFVAPGDGGGQDEHGHLSRGGDRIGLGEVRFSAAIPEPASATLLVASALCAVARRRNR